ncbi:MAG: enoyl-CoA hydratase/isomerase family protein, partial [Gammaproteobacteria bacterium]|nr:enoyl-CoA hydratase/isomerase family protein [Gammaproteobacteria bacterium]
MTIDAVLFETLEGKGGAIGLITLNRPNALNALNWEMCKAIQENLRLWEKEPHIKAVVIRGAGDKAFCAGGDVRHVYALGREQHYDDIMAFFHDEYALNYQISRYSKPYIAFMDGITMGGGAGLSVHAKFRIGTERLVMAMPETGIGFFPDIGATYFLPRCPYEIGTYLGLSGDKIDAADALYAQLIDYFIPSFHLDDVLDALLKIDFDYEAFDKVGLLLDHFAVKTESSSLYQHREIIQACFSHDTIEAILLALKTQKNPWHEHLSDLWDYICEAKDIRNYQKITETSSQISTVLENLICLN